MRSTGRFTERVDKKGRNDLTIILDASALIQMAYLIDPDDLETGAPPNPTLLQFVDQVGRMGAKVIIPESVVFETTGQRASGSPLTHQFENDIEYHYLDRFFKAVRSGAVPNTSIVKTDFGKEQLSHMETLKNDWEAFSQYRREHLFGFGDRDILQMVGRQETNGHVFVVTHDRNLTKALGETKTTQEKGVGSLNLIKFCGEIQKVAPISWLAPEVSFADIRQYLNLSLEHDNQRRVHNQRKKSLNKPYNNFTKGFEKTAEGEPSFGEALHALVYHGRGAARGF